MKRLMKHILAAFFLFASICVHARAVSGSFVEPSDSLVGGIEISDSLRAALEGASDTTAVEKVRDRGYDATKYSMMKRYRPKNVKFTAEKFIDNTFYSISARSFKLSNTDYSFGQLGTISAGKWFNPFCAVRLNFSAGNWKENYMGATLGGLEVSADYLFNVVSYLDGYRPGRFMEVSVLGGLGYAGAESPERFGNAFTAHVGLNMSLRLFPGVEFFIEPRAALYTNGIAVSKSGNWRSAMMGFQGDFGFTYTMGTAEYAVRRDYPWFVFLQGGTLFQNSKIVRDYLGVMKSLGMDFSAGGGKYFSRYFAIRASLGYSRCKWTEYKFVPYHVNYFRFRLEGLVDLVSLINGKKDNLVAASIIAGPEIGYMNKKEVDEKKVNSPYIGLTGAAQVNFRVWQGMHLFLEPRFSLIPYSAPSMDYKTPNDFTNYYDGLISLGLGVEYRF